MTGTSATGLCRASHEKTFSVAGRKRWRAKQSLGVCSPYMLLVVHVVSIAVIGFQTLRSPWHLCPTLLSLRFSGTPACIFLLKRPIFWLFRAVAFCSVQFTVVKICLSVLMCRHWNSTYPLLLGTACVCRWTCSLRLDRQHSPSTIFLFLNCWRFKFALLRAFCIYWYRRCRTIAYWRDLCFHFYKRLQRTSFLIRRSMLSWALTVALLSIYNLL